MPGGKESARKDCSSTSRRTARRRRGCRRARTPRTVAQMLCVFSPAVRGGQPSESAARGSSVFLPLLSAFGDEGGMQLTRSSRHSSVYLASTLLITRGRAETCAPWLNG